MHVVVMFTLFTRTNDMNEKTLTPIASTVSPTSTTAIKVSLPKPGKVGIGDYVKSW